MVWNEDDEVRPTDPQGGQRPGGDQSPGWTRGVGVSISLRSLPFWSCIRRLFSSAPQYGKKMLTWDGRTEMEAGVDAVGWSELKKGLRALRGATLQGRAGKTSPPRRPRRRGQRRRRESKEGWYHPSWRTVSEKGERPGVRAAERGAGRAERLQPAHKARLGMSPTLHSVVSHCQLETSHDGSIYTVEIGKPYTTALSPL